MINSARQKQRGYMGLSQVGIVNECTRKAWFIMNGKECEPFPGRILRLFRTGDDTELNIVTDLKDIGLTVHSEQKEVTATQNKLKLKGHIDGIVEGLGVFGFGDKPHLLEIKSCNDKRFKELKKTGDYCEWGGASYKAQVHIYATLLKIDRIFTVVENKNTSERHFSRFHRNRDFAIDTLRLAFDIMSMQTPPAPSFPANWYSCKWCGYRGVCRS